MTDWKKSLIVKRSSVHTDLYGIYTPDREFYYYRVWRKAKNKAEYPYYQLQELEKVLENMHELPPNY